MKPSKITLRYNDCAVVLRNNGAIDLYADEDKKLGFTTDNALAAIFLAHYCRLEGIKGLADEMRHTPYDGIPLQ